jgi:lysyl-tRNA synthetase class 1
MSDTPPALRPAALASKAWPFEEARKLLARAGDGPVVFETGYGPSGLPHIGTFGEVARTTMVRRAFGLLSDRPTRLIAFSDDMDGLRKVPDNVPNPELLRAHLGRPLTRVPDPFGTHDSFGAHNNARLRAFLDRFGFDYEFLSATDCYASGRFDAMLVRVLECWDEILGVMLPTLGPDRRATYAPVLPVNPRTGVVEQVAILERDARAATVTWRDPASGDLMTTPVTGGGAKLQWKVDWAMRWVALGVDYEMSGKDLIDSVTVSSRIARILGGRPPEGFNFEMFLDEAGQKISKSKGNGLTIEQWLSYAEPETLAFFMYREPRKAKQLHLGLIPRTVDEYWDFVGKYPAQPIDQQLGNPAFHVHGGPPPAPPPPLSFGLLLNLAQTVGGEEAVLRAMVARAGASGADVDALISHALAYRRDVAPPPLRRAPSAQERAGLSDLDARLAALPADADAQAIQSEIYEAGKAAGFEPLRLWFQALYETLLGQSQGPRMGSFIALYGLPASRALIALALGAASDRPAGATEATTSTDVRA